MKNKLTLGNVIVVWSATCRKNRNHVWMSVSSYSKVYDSRYHILKFGTAYINLQASFVTKKNRRESRRHVRM